MRAVRTKMTIPPIMDDVAAMLAFIDRQEAARRGPVGAHGYCMSGPYALAAAARYPDRIAAAASFYGTWLVNDAEESPHLSLGKVKGELYIACAEHDELAPLPMVEELRGLFHRAGTAGEIEFYPGVHHGFAFPQRWCYDKPAAERQARGRNHRRRRGGSSGSAPGRNVPSRARSTGRKCRTTPRSASADRAVALQARGRGRVRPGAGPAPAASPGSPGPPQGEPA